MADRKTKAIIGALQQKEKEQELLLCISNNTATIRTREDLASIIRQDVLRIFNATGYTIFLSDENTGKQIDFIANDSNRWNDSVLKVLDFEGITTPVIKQIVAKRVSEVFVAPFSHVNTVKGFLCLFSEQPGSFAAAQQNLLEGIASITGIAICNTLANEKIERQLIAINKYREQLEEEKLYLLEEQKIESAFEEIIGSGAEMQKVFTMIQQVAKSDSTVLLLGDTGTGKEVIARAIHQASSRHGKLMIKLNCAALPPSLIESELFGHEKGSFTGAGERRIGKFELANHSTLFLDEIGELAPELQVKLLRVLQEKEIERLGGNQTIKVDVRIIAATNRNLQREVENGRFRSDLFYRLNVFPIPLPPLRKRKEDIPALVAHFIQYYAGKTGKKVKNISRVAMESLLEYGWPGNIRELEHLIERSVLLSTGTTIKKIDMLGNPSSSVISSSDDFVIRPLAEIEKQYILKVLKKCGGRVSGVNGAAIKLGLPPTTLMSRMLKLKIKKEHFINNRS